MNFSEKIVIKPTVTELPYIASASPLAPTLNFSTRIPMSAHGDKRVETKNKKYGRLYELDIGDFMTTAPGVKPKHRVKPKRGENTKKEEQKKEFPPLPPRKTVEFPQIRETRKKKETSLKKKLNRERDEKKEESVDGGLRRWRSVDDVENAGNDEEVEIPDYLQALSEFNHSRKFRSYCDHKLSLDIDHLCKTILRKSDDFQKRKLEKSEIKAKANRRYICGIREAMKFLNGSRPIFLIMIAPNCEGTPEMVARLEEVKAKAREKGIPVVFCLNRNLMGSMLRKKAPVAVTVMFSVDGLAEEYKPLVEKLKVVKEEYAGRKKELLKSVVLGGNV